MTEKNKFNDWMLKIKNIHYADNDAMNRAYQKINDPKKQVKINSDK